MQKTLRKSAKTYSNENYNAASVLVRNNFDTEMRVPRTVFLTTRDNHPFDMPEEFYRRAIFYSA